MAASTQAMQNPAALPEIQAEPPIIEADPFREALGQLRLIGITGAAGSGKTTIAEYLFREANVQIISCADPIKEALSGLFKFPRRAWQDRTWKETPLPMIGQSPRQLAQTFGTEWGRRMVNEDIWISEVISRWRKSELVLTCVPDIRFDNEALHILRAGGVMIRVVRPDAPPVAQHVSEVSIPDNLVHLTIENTGSLEELFSKVERAITNHVNEALEAARQQLADAYS